MTVNYQSLSSAVDFVLGVIGSVMVIGSVLMIDSVLVVDSVQVVEAHLNFVVLY